MLTRRSLLKFAAAGVISARRRASASGGSFTGDPGENADFAHRIYALINEVRAANGAGELRWSEAAAECAREQSRRKVLLGFPGHRDPERGDISERLNSAGIGWSHCGENLFSERGWDDPVNSAIVWWWYSAGHQANLLNTDYTETGVGLAQAADGTWFATQIFFTPPPPAKSGTKRFR